MATNFNLERFIEAQKHNFSIAKKEIEKGRKETDWIWYIFPQLKGLGKSGNSNYYGLDGIAEALAYWNNETLRNNLIEITKILLSIENKNIEEIMGKHIDVLKMHSCMTLFYLATKDPIFEEVLKKHYNNVLDENTIRLIKK